MSVTSCLLVLDYNASSVLGFDWHSGAYIDAFVPPNGGGMLLPHAMVIGPGGDLFVANPLVAGGQLQADGVLRYRATSGSFIGNFVPAHSGGLIVPWGLTFGPDGNLYVTSGPLFGPEDPPHCSVLRYNGTSGAFIDVFVPGGSGGLANPLSLTFGPDRRLYVASAWSDSVLRYDGTTGALIGAFVPQGSGGLSFPAGLTFGPDENLYVSSSGNGRVLRYDGASGVFLGEFVSNAGQELADPRGLCFGPDGHLYVCSGGNGKVLRYDGATGSFLNAVVRNGLSFPVDLAFAQMLEPRWWRWFEQWRFVPRWLWGIVGFIFGVAIGQALGARESGAGRRIR